MFLITRRCKDILHIGDWFCKSHKKLIHNQLPNLPDTCLLPNFVDSAAWVKLQNGAWQNGNFEF